MPKVGDKAPSFSLLNQDGKPVALKDLAGKKVLLFAFPRAATPGCTRQACGMRDHLPAFKTAGALVLGISPDKPEALKKWRDAEGLPYDLLSDPDKILLTALGAYGEKTLYGKKSLGVIRSHFIIDEKGRFADVQLNVSPEQSVERARAFLGG